MNRTVKAALQIGYLWQRMAEESNGDPWKYRGEKQGLRDALQALKNTGAITEFRILPVTITADGKDYTLEDIKQPSANVGGPE